MARIVALWKRLNPKAKVGGRVAMDAIELRATIFSIRAYVDSIRGRRHSRRRSSSKVKSLLLLDDESYDKLKVRSKRIIVTLERHLKRANRALQRSIPQSSFAALMRAWKAHLRWMRLHIAYFKPPPRVVRGRKLQQQRALDELMEMAEQAIRHEGFRPPDSKELRRMMRPYASSARRGREGEYSVPYTLKRKLFYSANLHLADFVLDRLKLKELPKS